MVDALPAGLIEGLDEFGSRQRGDPEDRLDAAHDHPCAGRNDAQIGVLPIVRVKALHRIGAFGIAASGTAHPASIPFDFNARPGLKACPLESFDCGQRHVSSDSRR
jgi:hypothetical protein